MQTDAVIDDRQTTNLIEQCSAVLSLCSPAVCIDCLYIQMKGKFVFALCFCYSYNDLSQPANAGLQYDFSVMFILYFTNQQHQ